MFKVGVEAHLSPNTTAFITAEGTRQHPLSFRRPLGFRVLECLVFSLFINTCSGGFVVTPWVSGGYTLFERRINLKLRKRKRWLEGEGENRNGQIREKEGLSPCTA